MFDAFGKEYLDFSAGIAVNALGEAARWARWADAVRAVARDARTRFSSPPRCGPPRTLRRGWLPRVLRQRRVEGLRAGLLAAC